MHDRNFTHARFIPVIQLPQIDSHLKAKLYVDIAIDEISLVRNIQHKDFNNNLTNIKSITLNKQAENGNQVNTKVYADHFHQEIERSRQNLGVDFYDESIDSVKNNQDKDPNHQKLIYLDSITANRNPTSVNKLSNKKYTDVEFDKNTVQSYIRKLSKSICWK